MSLHRDETVVDIRDSELFERVIRNLRNMTPMPRQRWALVRDAFACGATVARRLCLRAGLPADQEMPPINPGWEQV